MKTNKNKNQVQKSMSIRKTAERLNPVIFKNILFIHAWSGCDTKSAIFNKGKTALMKQIAIRDCKVLDISSTFDKTDATLEKLKKLELNCL